jgi:hypothetical protein
MNKPSREPQKIKEITKERPLDCIKCFPEVNLDGAAGRYTPSPIASQ